MGAGISTNLRLLHALKSLALIMVGLLSPPVQAQPTPMVGFEPVGIYVVDVDGQRDPKAEIFVSRSARAILVMSPRLASPVLLGLGTRQVEAVHLLKIDKKSDGTIDLLPDPTYDTYGLFAVDGQDVKFTAGSRQVVVGPKPDLLGPQRVGDLRANDPAYARKQDAYVPSRSVLDALRSQAQPVRLAVYFGSWCPFCGEMVPRVMKVAEELAGSRIRIDFYGVPRRISEDPHAQQMRISGVPEGVVYVGDSEVGRITGQSWKNPEQALLEILQGS